MTANLTQTATAESGTPYFWRHERLWKGEEIAPRARCGGNPAREM